MTLDATPQIAQFFNMPAPSGGLDAVSNLMEMEPTEALYAYNLIMTQEGPTVRPGNIQWCTNLTGTGGVRTIIPVKGGGTAGAEDHLFACTATGIWDCTGSSSAPTLVVTFGTQTGNAGFCEYDYLTDLAGEVILLVCDEVNGYYTFNANTTTWTKVTQAFHGTGTGTGTTALTINSTISGVITVGAELYTLSGGTLTDTGLSIVSGSGTSWVLSGNYTGSSASIVILNNSSQIYGTDPANFAAVHVFNNQVWFVQSGSGNAWYLQNGSIWGQVTLFAYGNRFKHGGNLSNLYTFTYGSAFGTYAYLVAISDSGDVIAYTGSNPSNAANWTLSGVWYVGDVPAGRRPCSNYGGDLNILCAYGVLQLSALFFQKNPEDPTLALTRKIAPAVASDINTYTGIRGFQFVEWPSQQSLLITVPIVAGNSYRQYCYNLSTNAWSLFQTLDFQCGTYWHGNLYVGTSQGTVLSYTGNADNVQLGGSGAIAINFGCLGAFQNPKPGVNKMVDLVRAYFITTSPVQYKTFCQFDFDLTDLLLGSVPYVASASSGGWDSGLWDSAIWGNTAVPSPQKSLRGATGMGQFVAIGCLGATMGQTRLIGYGVSARITKGFL